MLSYSDVIATSRPLSPFKTKDCSSAECYTHLEAASLGYSSKAATIENFVRRASEDVEFVLYFVASRSA